MIKTLVIFIVVIILGALVSLGSCEKKLSGAGQAAVLAYSEAATDNLFAGLTANDYAVFSRDFDTYMQGEISAAKFTAWKQNLDDKIGSYIDREVDHVRQSGEFYVVSYRARFEQEEKVIVEVAFHAAEPYFIANVWLDSEKLRQK